MAIPPSPTHSASTSLDDIREIDKLLQDDNDLEAGGGVAGRSSLDASTTYPRTPSTSQSPPPPSTSALLSLISLIPLSATTTFLSTHLALQSKLSVCLTPLLHFSSLLFVCMGLQKWKPDGLFGGSNATRVGLGGDGVGGGSAKKGKKLGLLVGGTSALALALGLLQARMLDAKVWQAIEVLVLPSLILLAPLAPLASRRVPPPNTFGLVCLGSAFLVAFSLIGVPAVDLGILVAILRLPVEATRLVVLAAGLELDNPGDFLMSGASSGLVASLILFFIGLFPSLHETGTIFTLFDFFILILYHLFSLLTLFSLLLTLHHFTSPLYAAISLLPRNLLLLVSQTFEVRGHLQLRGNWAQMLFVLIGSSIGSIVSEPDLFKSLQTFTTSLHSTITRKKSTWSQTPSPPTSPTSSPSSTTTRQLPSRRLALLSLLPLLIYLLQSPSTITSLSTACSYLPPNVRSTLCHTFTSPTSRTVDLVIAYYDEDLSHSRNHIEEMRNVPFVRERSNRVVLYNKGPKGEEELRKELKLRRDDEVVGLPNYGREGATYLQHILLHYNASIDALANALDPDAETQTGKGRKLRTKVLADHTFFLQPHLAWDFIARPRIGLVGPDTGFAHFGPMMRSVCGEDGRGTGTYSYLGQLYNIFEGEVCPPTGQLSAWSAQFVVSKRRILSNAYKRYAAFDALMEAPDSHWIHNMWGANDSGGQSNPALGHHLERSWPIIFHCSDPLIADQCPDEVNEKEKCQCLDL